MPVLEAMHLGLPVVLRAGTAAEELYEEEDFMFNNNNEAVSVIQELIFKGEIDLCLKNKIERIMKLTSQFMLIAQ